MITINLHPAARDRCRLTNGQSSFTGVYPAKLSAKGALRLPESYRRILKKGPVIARLSFIFDNGRVLPPGLPALIIEAKANNLQEQKKLPRQISAQFAAAGAEAFFNQPGNLLVPREILRRAGLSHKDTLVALGCGNYIEILRKADWQEYCASPQVRAALQQTFRQFYLRSNRH